MAVRSVPRVTQLISGELHSANKGRSGIKTQFGLTLKLVLLTPKWTAVLHRAPLVPIRYLGYTVLQSLRSSDNLQVKLSSDVQLFFFFLESFNSVEYKMI